MFVKKLYEFPCGIQNEFISKMVYKFNKLVVNLVYPIYGKKLSWALNDESKYIVSMTSYPDRISTVWIALSTLLRQTYHPKKIILWLAQEQFEGGEKSLPSELLNLKKYGLSISFCDNLYSHKKYYYVMQQYPEATIVTVDDDVFYPEDFLQRLIDTAIRFPDTVCCTWGHETSLNENGQVRSCDQWVNSIKLTGNKPSFALVPTGIGGVLYPPHALDKEVFNRRQIEKLCINADDLWLKFMALLKQTPAVRIDGPAKIYFSIIKTQRTGLYYENIGKHKSAQAWNELMKVYPICGEIIKTELQQRRK